MSRSSLKIINKYIFLSFRSRRIPNICRTSNTTSEKATCREYASARKRRWTRWNTALNSEWTPSHLVHCSKILWTLKYLIHCSKLLIHCSKILRRIMVQMSAACADPLKNHNRLITSGLRRPSSAYLEWFVNIRFIVVPPMSEKLGESDRIDIKHRSSWCSPSACNLIILTASLDREKARRRKGTNEKKAWIVSGYNCTGSNKKCRKPKKILRMWVSLQITLFSSYRSIFRAKNYNFLALRLNSPTGKVRVKDIRKRIAK